MQDQAIEQKIQNQAHMLANRVHKRFRHLHKRFERQGIEAFRLYDWDIPEIRAVVDWYAGHLVIAEYMREQSLPQWLPAMAQAVATILQVPMERVHLKKRHAGIRDGKRYDRMDRTCERIAVKERDLRFWINPHDFVDTGLFSDHRNTRLLVREMASDKDFLNLYCYTASFTCYAAAGGARASISVDRSQGNLDWARDNFILNGLKEKDHMLVRADVPEYLDRLKGASRRFDLAILDPPSYSSMREKDHTFDINQEHPALIHKVLDVMKKGGTLFFSTNHQGFEPLLSSLRVEKIEEITEKTLPEDYQSKQKRIHRCWRILI
ncbi:class I SAM-dependent methyltransferase [Desulfobotulus sp.]|jgi:23S rRNA G2069 N7-methylase RlmK/C1962 C5-methylase RlmI|uniref:class I SAM-dependent methyltransferase n=1 Tax=Desulfobotulus sp. TaxID=1940337 RepID=UPI002A35AB7A|nr:class I SAM-dependent methyltransferase [Desulfobotulus sp.]MDY0162698.1 class I SAM-dependent methyltransferase [Desulfobotulus sp.]